MHKNNTKSLTNIVHSVTDAILKTIKEEFYGPTIIRALMETPTIWDVDVNILTQALVLVLHIYKIKLPKNIADAIKALKPGPYTFEVPNIVDGLKPRKVLIDLSPGKKILLIAGSPPIPGKDGFFTPSFKFDPHHKYHIDALTFADIIKLPEATEGQIIGRLFLPTQGTPGVSVTGQKIEPPAGNPYELFIGDGVTTKRAFSPEEEQEYDELIATQKGVILPQVSYSQEKYKIIGLTIKSHFEVGEIDCVACDEKTILRCTPALTVNGAMRGRSIFVFGSYLDVKGVIEGPGVHISNSVTTAPLVLTIDVAEDIFAESIYNARIHANGNAFIMKDMLRVDLTANTININRDTSYFDSLIGYVSLTANKIILNHVNIRNILELNIGKELFEKKAQLEEKRESITVLYNNITEELQEKVTSLNEKIETLNTVAELDIETKDAIQAIYSVLGRLIKKNCSPEQANQLVMMWVQNYGKRFFAIGKGLLAILKLFTEQNEFITDLSSVESQLASIEQQLQQIQVKITGYMGIYGKIVIRCAGQELNWENNTSSERESVTINLKYKPDKGLVVKGRD